MFSSYVVFKTSGCPRLTFVIIRICEQQLGWYQMSEISRFYHLLLAQNDCHLLSSLKFERVEVVGEFAVSRIFSILHPLEDFVNCFDKSFILSEFDFLLDFVARHIWNLDLMMNFSELETNCNLLQSISILNKTAAHTIEPHMAQLEY